MAKKQALPKLSAGEMEIMDVLWQHGPSSVQQVLDQLPKNPPLAYNSVLTTIRILEKKGYLRHVKDGRAHIYRPVIERDEATRWCFITITQCGLSPDESGPVIVN